MAVVGSIYWGGGWSNDPLSPVAVDARALSHPTMQGKALHNGYLARPNRIKWDISQARMDTEIGYANMLGPHYWAFAMYSAGMTDAVSSVGMRKGLELYRASTVKGTLKWCMIQSPGNMGTPGNFTTQVNLMAPLMAEAAYQRVLTNRPLLYLQMPVWPPSLTGSGWTNAEFATMLSALRTAVQAQGAGNPYIVLFGKQVAETLRAEIGADAVSMYVEIPNTKRRNRPYAEMSAHVQADWPNWLSAAAVVPTVTVGWDNRVREFTPGPWTPANKPRMGYNGWYQRATDAEVAAHFAAAKTFNAANAAKCPADAILAYSWNEAAEGHAPLCPTRADIAAGTWPARAAAIAAALNA